MGASVGVSVGPAAGLPLPAAPPRPKHLSARPPRVEVDPDLRARGHLRRVERAVPALEVHEVEDREHGPAHGVELELVAAKRVVDVDALLLDRVPAGADPIAAVRFCSFLQR